MSDELMNSQLVRADDELDRRILYALETAHLG